MINNRIDKDYNQLLADLKRRVTSARYKAALSVNRELILLYHHIGTIILKAQLREGWGAKVIDHLSKDLRLEFPDMKGFSPQNLKYMRKFAEEYTQEEIGQQAVDQIPWGHVVTVMYSGLDKKQQAFYIEGTIKNGWSRNILSMQIETNLYKRQGEAITNFKEKLPSPPSNLAHYTLKDPYILNFLSRGAEIDRRRPTGERRCI